MTATHSARVAYARKVLDETAEVPADDVEMVAHRAKLRAALEQALDVVDEQQTELWRRDEGP